MDSVSLVSLILSIISTIVIFVKGIKKCKCGNFLVIERETDIDKQLEAHLDRSIQQMLERNINKNNTTKRSLFSSSPGRKSDRNKKEKFIQKNVSCTTKNIKGHIVDIPETNIVRERQFSFDNNKPSSSSVVSPHIIVKHPEDMIKTEKNCDETRSSSIDIDECKSDDNRMSISISSDSTAPKVYTQFVLKK